MGISPELAKLVRDAKNKFSASSGKAVKLKEGKTVIRVLGKPGEVFWAENGVHWIKAEEKGKPIAVVGCHDIVHGTPCPVCAAIERATASVTDDDELKLVKDWKAKKTIYICALVRSGPDKSDQPQVVELTPTTFGKILSILEEYAAADIDMLHPTTGFDLTVERTGKGLNTEYSVNTTPKSDPFDPKLLENLPDLKAIIEKEFFRGEENKAVTAIGNISGVSMGTAGPALAAPAAAKAPALAGPGTIVEDAVIEEAINEIEASPPTAPVATAELTPEQRLAAAKAAKAAAAAKPATPPKAAETPKVEAPPTATELPKEDVDSLLKELDELDV